MNRELLTEIDRQKLLVGLITRHQRQIFAYIYTFVPDRHNAEDLLQETSLTICEKFAEFEPGTDFVAWACKIAWWRIRFSRQRFARSKVIFNDEVLSALARTVSEIAPKFDERHEVLESCLEKLSDRDREFVLLRYEPEGGVAEAARRTGRSVESAYRALNRLRRTLHDCVMKQLANPETLS